MKVRNAIPKMMTLHILAFTTMVSKSGSINANMFYTTKNPNTASVPARSKVAKNARTILPLGNA